MSTNLPNLYARQFASTVELLLQQAGSRLRGKVDEKSGYRGEQASPVDQLGSVEMQPVGSRFSPMGRVDVDVDRRWIFPSWSELPQLIDENDTFQMVVDPKSKYVQNALAAAGRKIDRVLISAMLGTNYTGKTGSTSTSLPAGQSIAVNFGAAADVGLTVAKLREARRIFMAANLDMEKEEFYCGVTATEHDALLGETQVISLDYNDRPTVVDGKVTRMMGFNFVHSELFGESLSSGDHQVICWAKSKVHLGFWQDVMTDISKRNDLTSIPWQVYLKMGIGATRLEEEGVVRILCNI